MLNSTFGCVPVVCVACKEGIKKARNGMPSAWPTTHIEGMWLADMECPHKGLKYERYGIAGKGRRENPDSRKRKKKIAERKKITEKKDSRNHP